MGLLGKLFGKGPSPPPPDRLPRRNDPCWCGSGKKYKQCHLKEDEARLDRIRTRAACSSGG